MNARTRAITLIAAGVMLACSGGCYSKVVGAKGIGSDELAPRREQPTTTIIDDLGNAVRGDKKK